MGYTLDKTGFHVLNSDTAGDFVEDLAEALVSRMKRHARLKEEDCYNTDGILNVAMTLADCFKGQGWYYGCIIDYASDFIPSFEEYIKKQIEEEWYNEKNKQLHIKAYRKLLGRIKKLANIGK